MFKYLLTIYLTLLPLSCCVAGELIEVCGIDGSGKSTFVRLLADALSERGLRVATLKPLQGNAKVRSFLDELDADKAGFTSDRVPALVERFKSDYFLLSLLHHKAIIEALLFDHDYVICDRYLLSHRTYQECFEQYAVGDEEFVEEMPSADYTFLLTLPIETAMHRILNRNDDVRAYENPVFLRRAQQLFFEYAPSFPNVVALLGDEIPEENVCVALDLLGKNEE